MRVRERHQREVVPGAVGWAAGVTAAAPCGPACGSSVLRSTTSWVAAIFGWPSWACGGGVAVFEISVVLAPGLGLHDRGGDGLGRALLARCTDHVDLLVLRRGQAGWRLAHRSGGCSLGGRRHRAGALGQRAALFGRQREVGIPTRLAVLRADLAHLLELQARPAALVGGHARPFGHAVLHALTLVGRHGGKARCDFQPLLLAGCVDALPVALQRRQRRLLCRRQRCPGRATGNDGRGGARHRLRSSTRAHAQAKKQQRGREKAETRSESD